VRTKAQISVSRVAIFYPLGPGLGKGTWQGDLARGLASAVICGSGIARFGPGPALPTPAVVLLSMMLASCEPLEPRQLQVAHFRRKARRLLRQTIECHAAGPSLAGLRTACNASAPQ
jgi:hypothetical protein